jgi:hypothetical protein
VCSSNSSLESDILEEVVQAGLPRVALTRWNYNIRTVSVVYENIESLKDCFKIIEERCTNTTTINEASSYRRALEDPNFVFWLTVSIKSCLTWTFYASNFKRRRKIV